MRIEPDWKDIENKIHRSHLLQDTITIILQHSYGTNGIVKFIDNDARKIQIQTRWDENEYEWINVDDILMVIRE